MSEWQSIKSNWSSNVKNTAGYHSMFVEETEIYNPKPESRNFSVCSIKLNE